jgi:hypothetical protein
VRAWFVPRKRCTKRLKYKQSFPGAMDGPQLLRFAPTAEQVEVGVCVR